MTYWKWGGVLTVLALVTAVTAYRFAGGWNSPISLDAKIKEIVSTEGRTEISCGELLAQRPIVLLALGQSNAGNHGEAKAGVAEPVNLAVDGKCFRTIDPLPGGTGQGGSIWQRLPRQLQSLQNSSRPVVLSVLAIDSTSISDWTGAGSSLRSRLAAHIASLIRTGMRPDFVLWQQGEADARLGTSASDYSAGLDRLANQLEEAGASAPILLARSTLCRSAPSVVLRQAIEEKVRSDSRFRLGPDTDVLAGDRYRVGCHMAAEGLDGAAKMWATSIQAESGASGAIR